MMRCYEAGLMSLRLRAALLSNATLTEAVEHGLARLAIDLTGHLALYRLTEAVLLACSNLVQSRIV